MVSDLIYVDSEEFARLRRDNVGNYLIDNVGAEMIVLNDTIIRVWTINPPEALEEEVVE